MNRHTIVVLALTVGTAAQSCGGSTNNAGQKRDADVVDSALGRDTPPVPGSGSEGGIPGRAGMGGIWGEGGGGGLLAAIGGDGGAGGAGGGGNYLPYQSPFSYLPGVAWVNLGLREALSSPTCRGAPISGRASAGPAMASSASCSPSSISWKIPNATFPEAMCVSAQIPALPASATEQDKADNWGVMVGYSFTDSTPLSAGYKSVTYVIETGSPTSPTPLQRVLHLKGDPDDVFYCNDYDLITFMIPFTGFRSPCHDRTGVETKFLRDSDVPNIDKVGLLVEPGAEAFAVNNLCFREVIFNSGLTGTGGSAGMVVSGTGGANGNGPS